LQPQLPLFCSETELKNAAFPPFPTAHDRCRLPRYRYLLPTTPLPSNRHASSAAEHCRFPSSQRLPTASLSSSPRRPCPSLPPLRSQPQSTSGALPPRCLPSVTATTAAISSPLRS
ncbi:unnamed protein product, partial [Musa textilis]